MNCVKSQEEMGVYLGEKPETFPKDFLSHLQQCESCFHEWEELQDLVATIKLADPVSDPGELFWQKQRVNIGERLRENAGFSWFPRWAMFFSLGILLLFVGLQINSKNKNVSSGTSSALFLEEEDLATDELIDEFDPDQLQKAIQILEKGT